MRKADRDSSLEESREKSEAENERWDVARIIQASRHASHSSGRMCFLQVASGKTTIGGRGVALGAIVDEEGRFC